MISETEINSMIENAINELCYKNPLMTDKELMNGLKRYVKDE